MKIKTIAILAVGLVVAITFAGVIVTKDSQENNDGPDAILIDKLAALENNLQRTQAEVRNLNSRSTRERAIPSNIEDLKTEPFATKHDAGDHKPDAPQLSAEEQNELIDTQVHETMASTLNNQRYDKSWTDDTSESIDNLIEEVELDGTDVLMVDCKETMCQIELAHTDQLEYEKFRDFGIGRGPFRTNVFFDFDVETNETKIYVSKAGYDLPRPQ